MCAYIFIGFFKFIIWIIKSIISSFSNIQARNSNYYSQGRSQIGGKSVATYEQIQKYVRSKYGYVPKTCWIAHCKEIYGIDVRVAPNRISNVRTNPCPLEKQKDILDAFIYFRML